MSLGGTLREFWRGPERDEDLPPPGLKVVEPRATYVEPLTTGLTMLIDRVQSVGGSVVFTSGRFSLTIDETAWIKLGRAEALEVTAREAT